jgi:hypothetical protein
MLCYFYIKSHSLTDVTCKNRRRQKDVTKSDDELVL